MTDDFLCPRCNVNHSLYKGEICDECYEKEEHLNAAQRGAAKRGKAKPSKNSKNFKKRK